MLLNISNLFFTLLRFNFSKVTGFTWKNLLYGLTNLQAFKVNCCQGNIQKKKCSYDYTVGGQHLNMVKNANRSQLLPFHDCMVKRLVLKRYTFSWFKQLRMTHAVYHYEKILLRTMTNWISYLKKGAEVIRDKKKSLGNLRQIFYN